MNKYKIVCVHLFNNYSGSPKVLQDVITGLLQNNYEVDLIVNKSEGFLSEIKGIKYNYIDYKWDNNQFITLLYYLISQIQIFFKIITKYNSKNTIIYINTITPIGAAIACKIFKGKIVYHVHEKYIDSNFLHKLFESVYLNSNAKSIFVSKYLMNSYNININDSLVIYNSLDKTFRELAAYNLKNRRVEPKTILMVCSLRDYKGIYEFVKLSNLLPAFKFELVLSSTKKEVDNFISEVKPKSNLNIFDNQINLHPFYQRAKLLLNLSNPVKWIETFGLTILEAMEYGIPSIVPNVGGPTELIKDGYNGFLINSSEINKIKKCIEILMTDEKLYFEFSRNSTNKSKEFCGDKMNYEIDMFINNI